MIADEIQPGQKMTQEQWTKRWKAVGVIVLLLGGIIAGALYWHGKQSEALMDQLSMQGFDRAARRQMGMLYGKSGYVIEDFINQLKQPGTQAIAVSILALVISAGCFFFAKLSPFRPDDEFFKPSQPNQNREDGF